MKGSIAKYLFYTVALSALIAPFAIKASDPQRDPGLASATAQQHWSGGNASAGEDPAPRGSWRAHRRGARAWAVRQALQRLDTNGDGRIDAAEFQAPRQDRFAAIDADGDGALTLAELQQFRERADRDRLAKRFAALDANGDGKVNREEIRQFRFQRLDRDGDGTLSPRELYMARAPGAGIPPAPAAP